MFKSLNFGRMRFGQNAIQLLNFGRLQQMIRHGLLVFVLLWGG